MAHYLLFIGHADKSHRSEPWSGDREAGEAMIAVDAAHEVRHWVAERLGDLMNRKTIEEPSTAEIWNQVSPLLDRGLTIYDKAESASTPVFT